VFVNLKTWVATAIRETTVEVVVDEGEEDSDPTVTRAGERAVDMVEEVATRTQKPQALEMKFAPNSQGTGKNHTYATVKDYVLQYIQKTYDGGYDVATSLEDEVLVDLNNSKPVRLISRNSDPDEQRLEQEGHNIDYEDTLKRWNDRRDLLDREMKKAYSLIKENYCTRAMQSRIEEHPDY